MKGNNLVLLRGHLGGDPEPVELPSGKVVEMSLATSSHWRDGSGAWKERTDWHRIAVHGPRAEWAHRVLRCGDHVFVLGAIRPRTWTQADGTKRTAVSIRAWEVQCLTPKSHLKRSPPAERFAAERPTARRLYEQ